MGALGEGAVAAEMAFEAGDMMVKGHAITDVEWDRPDSAARRSHLDDDAGGFVSKNARRPDFAVLDFLDVGGADAADGDFDEEFAGLNGGHGDGFEPEVVGAAIDNGAHGGGDGGLHEFLDRILKKNKC
jgi:hypothetical protein